MLILFFLCKYGIMFTFFEWNVNYPARLREKESKESSLTNAQRENLNFFVLFGGYAIFYHNETQYLDEHEFTHLRWWYITR